MLLYQRSDIVTFGHIKRLLTYLLTYLLLLAFLAYAYYIVKFYKRLLCQIGIYLYLSICACLIGE